MGKVSIYRTKLNGSHQIMIFNSVAEAERKLKSIGSDAQYCGPITPIEE